MWLQWASFELMIPPSSDPISSPIERLESICEDHVPLG